MMTQLPPLPDEDLSGRALCALCAEYGHSCCATDPALGYLSFPLSAPEWRRLLAYAHLATETDDEPAATAQAAPDALESIPAAPDSMPAAPAGPDSSDSAQDFPDSMPAEGDAVCQPWPNHPDFITSMLTLFPKEKKRIHELFPAKGRHLSLRLRANGACVFLGQEGCRLPRAVRPWYCLLFPAWVVSGQLTIFTPEECCIARRAASPMHGIRLMAVEPGELKELYWLLRRDWQIERG